MDPINYSQFVPQIDIGRQFFSGLQAGAAMGSIENTAEKQRLALEQAKQYKNDVAAAMSTPTPQNFASLALKYPGQREAIKQSWDQLSEADRKAEGDTMAQAYRALLANNPEAAQGVIQQQIDARKNSGLDTAHYDSALNLVKSNPQQALGVLGFTLAYVSDPKTFAEQFGKLSTEQRAQVTAPAELRKANADATSAEADATTKGVQAKYADQGALLDLQKKGWDIEAIKADNEYKRNQTKIGYLNAQFNKETNQLKRQELQLQIEKTRQEQGDKVRAKVADAESAAGSIDNMLNNIGRILSVASDKDGKATSVLRAAAGPLDSRLPTVQGDVADLEALVETLGSQAFLSQIPNIKGMGALSNAEGEKLQSAFQNFSLKQSPEQIIRNLSEAKRLLEKGRGLVSKRYGVPLGNPDTPAGGEKRPPLSSFGG